MPVQIKKQLKQQEVLKQLGIKKEDLEEKFVLASGPGGQKVNKTSSAVQLKHRPTGLEVHASEDRSRDVNRYLAREKLIEAFQQKVLKIQTKKEKDLARKKKQKQRRKRKAKSKYQNNQEN